MSTIRRIKNLLILKYYKMIVMILSVKMNSDQNINNASNNKYCTVQYYDNSSGIASGKGKGGIFPLVIASGIFFPVAITSGTHKVV